MHFPLYFPLNLRTGAVPNSKTISKKGKDNECLDLFFGVRLPGFKSQLCHLVAVWSWPSCLSSLCFNEDSNSYYLMGFLWELNQPIKYVKHLKLFLSHSKCYIRDSPCYYYYYYFVYNTVSFKSCHLKLWYLIHNDTFKFYHIKLKLALYRKWCIIKNT